MEEENFQLYDEICNAVIIVLNRVANEHDKKLRVDEFDETNKAHLAILELCRIYNDLNANVEVSIGAKWSARRIVKKMGLKWKWGSADRTYANFPDFIEYIEDAYEAPGALEKIYDAYYKR